MALADEIIGILPNEIKCIFMLSDKSIFPRIREIRLRKNAPVLLVLDCGNVFLTRSGEAVKYPPEYAISEKLIADTVSAFCKGSVYSFEKEIRQGFIPFTGGVRVGVCASLSCSGISAVNSVCIRIPHDIRNCCAKFISEAFYHGKPASALVYSAPGGGKTAFLADLAAELSHGVGTSPKRVAICDERFEFAENKRLALCDMYSGFPKAQAIEIATRTASPEIIICDEIGGSDEAKAILFAQNSGVPLIASAHAGTQEELFLRPHIKSLIENKVFSYIYSIQSGKLEKIC